MAPPAGPISLSGTAATGAPFLGAKITATDRNGVATAPVDVDKDGKYSVTLASNAVFPVVLTGVRDDQTLVSVAADSATPNVNVTPITNLIAALLTKSGDPAKLATEIAKNPDIASATKVNAKVDEVVKFLQPLLDAAGSTTTNPLSDKFAADGNGLDRALDSLSIKIVPSSETSSNIEVAIKQGSDEGATPIKPIKFTKSETLASLPAPVDKPTTLVKSGTAPLIAYFGDRDRSFRRIVTVAQRVVLRV